MLIKRMRDAVPIPENVLRLAQAMYDEMMKEFYVPERMLGKDDPKRPITATEAIINGNRRKQEII